MKYSGFEKEEHFDRLSFYNGDCMDLLKQTPDKYYDLALVDPPYGIGISGNPVRQQHTRKSWDDAIPDKEYFDQLFRVSKNQIVWGGNYFGLPPTQGFIIWNKVQPENFSLAMCEYAWTSMNTPAKIYKKRIVGADKDGRIHPTQKPVALYDWLIKNYAKQGDKILDTHLGSGSIAIAIEKANRINNMGLQFTGIELDEEYYNAALQRFKIFAMQQTIMW